MAKNIVDVALELAVKAEGVVTKVADTAAVVANQLERVIDDLTALASSDVPTTDAGGSEEKVSREQKINTIKDFLKTQGYDTGQWFTDSDSISDRMVDVSYDLASRALAAKRAVGKTWPTDNVN